MIDKINKPSLILAAALVLGISGLCFADDAPTPTTPTETASVSAPETLPQLLTQMGDTLSNDKVAVEKSSFNKDTAAVYLVVTSDGVKKGQEMKAVWIAEDTNGVAPANYKIDEKSVSVDDAMSSGKNYIVTFSLSKPNAGWPLGTYHVDLYLGDTLAKTIKFDIK